MMQAQKSKHPADWDVWWICNIAINGLGLAPYSSWESSGEGQKQICRLDDKCCCIQHTGFNELGGLRGPDGLCLSSEYKCCCQYNSCKCSCVGCLDENGICQRQNQECYLKLDEKKCGGRGDSKCFCVKQSYDNRLEGLCDESMNFYKNACRCCCFIGEDSAKVTDLQGEAGFVAVDSRILCIISTCNIIPQKIFVECCGVRLFGPSKGKGGDFSASATPPVTVQDGGAKFGSVCDKGELSRCCLEL